MHFCWKFFIGAGVGLVPFQLQTICCAMEDFQRCCNELFLVLESQDMIDYNIDGLMQDCGKLQCMELLQSCTKPLICNSIHLVYQWVIAQEAVLMHWSYIPVCLSCTNSYMLKIWVAIVSFLWWLMLTLRHIFKSPSDTSFVAFDTTIWQIGW